jgi:hypothetical protein
MEKQQNFEDTLFEEPKEELEKPEDPKVVEIIRCQYCQDVGECTLCKRGQKEMEDNKVSAKKLKKAA